MEHVLSKGVLRCRGLGSGCGPQSVSHVHELVSAAATARVSEREGQNAGVADVGPDTRGECWTRMLRTDGGRW